MRNLIKSLCSCQTQWHLRQLGSARRQQRLRDGSGGGSGGKCNCHMLAQAASKDTLLISGGALRNKRRSSHTNQHPNVSMRIWICGIWIWISESEYEKLNCKPATASETVRGEQTSSPAVGQLNWPIGANSRICLWPSHICDKSPHAAANYVPHLPHTRPQSAWNQPESQPKITRKSATAFDRSPNARLGQ